MNPLKKSVYPPFLGHTPTVHTTLLQHLFYPLTEVLLWKTCSDWLTTCSPVRKKQAKKHLCMPIKWVRNGESLKSFFDTNIAWQYFDPERCMQTPLFLSLLWQESIDRKWKWRDRGGQERFVSRDSKNRYSHSPVALYVSAVSIRLSGLKMNWFWFFFFCFFFFLSLLGQNWPDYVTMESQLKAQYYLFNETKSFTQLFWGDGIYSTV